MWLDNLKKMKKISGKTSQQISAETNIPKSTIDKLFSGQTKEPYLNSTKSIVHCLGYTLDDLVEAKDNGLIQLTDEEQQIILAYRANPDMQKAIKKLLDINVVEKTIPALVVARSSDYHGMYTEEITAEQLKLLQSQEQPSSDDEL